MPALSQAFSSWEHLAGAPHGSTGLECGQAGRGHAPPQQPMGGGGGGGRARGRGGEARAPLAST